MVQGCCSIGPISGDSADDLKDNPITLSVNYLKNRRLVADRRMVAAAVRLAERLNNVAPTNADFGG